MPENKSGVIKDLVFIMSEISNYLNEGDPLNQGKVTTLLSFILHLF